MLKPFEAITRTGFFVSLVSYVIFWLADTMVSGFVSRFFSVHIFLLASLVFGFLWASVVKEYASMPILQVAVAVFCGLVLTVLTWNLTQDFGITRVPLALLGACVPTILYTFIRI